MKNSKKWLSSCIVLESKLEREKREITDRIIDIHRESKGRYGAPKIHQTLVSEGISVSLKRVQRLMKNARISSVIQKKYKPYSSKKVIEERENILKQDFTTTTINRNGWLILPTSTR